MNYNHALRSSVFALAFRAGVYDPVLAAFFLCVLPLLLFNAAIFPPCTLMETESAAADLRVEPLSTSSTLSFHMQTDTHSLSHSPTHTLSLSHTLSHTHTRTVSHTLPRCPCGEELSTLLSPPPQRANLCSGAMLPVPSYVNASYQPSVCQHKLPALSSSSSD